MPKSPPKFLCDEMLKRLGRWLRVAGYDVSILADGTDDREIVRFARAHGRVLLTRDRGLAKQTATDTEIVLLTADDLEGCVSEINRRLDVDWQWAPFSRCMHCNTLLTAADPAQRSRAPNEVIRSSASVLYCPNCDQLFWSGSHVAHMRIRLATWNRSRFCGARKPLQAVDFGQPLMK